MENDRGCKALIKRANGRSRHAATCLNLSWIKNLKTREQKQKRLSNVYLLIQYLITNFLFDETGWYFVLLLPSPHLEVLIASSTSGCSRFCKEFPHAQPYPTFLLDGLALAQRPDVSFDPSTQ